jgi:Trpc4-associated protein
MLQFNALLLGVFPLEVLFVLYTLLGGRRKIDAQEILKSQGLIPILEDVFERLPWDSLTIHRERVPHNTRGLSGVETQPTGIHGPRCECTPEIALCVQYLRLLHNFCDRDCDNYAGRRLLLSVAEREFIFAHPRLPAEYDISTLPPGLLSKISTAFMGESDESPYRFWLASCIESYLRGSSPS